METRTRGGGGVRGGRLLAAALTVAVGAVAGLVAAPSPAAAKPPDGEMCQLQRYTVTNDHGMIHERYSEIPALSFTNSSSTPATWSEQFSVETTFSSTVTTSTTITGGVDLGVVSAEVEHTTTVQTVTSVTVNHTTGFETEVLPFSTKHAQYGTWRQVVTGTYESRAWWCSTGQVLWDDAGTVTARLIRADDSVGWWLRDSL